MKTVFVKNLPWDLKEEELGDFFHPCGKIENVRFVYNSSNGNFKGFAFIDFKQTSSLFTAIKFNGKVLKGRKIIVDVDQGKPKRGFKYRPKEEMSKYNNDLLEIKKKKIKK